MLKISASYLYKSKSVVPMKNVRPLSKVNSEQEAIAKLFLVHTHLNLKSCQPHEKQNKNYQKDKSIDKKLKTKGLMFFHLLFHGICWISNFNV